MSTIMVIGESGTGKSTSIRNLDPEATFLIQIVNKPLPFRGAKKKFILATKDQEGNKFITDDFEKVGKIIEKINKNPKIKTLIIDDFQYVMSIEYMRRAEEKGWQKFTDIAAHVFQILEKNLYAREDLNVILLTHAAIDEYGRMKAKTIGKMIDEKITIEGLCTIVLQAKMVDDKYMFQTQSDPTTIAKSPMGMFEEKLIPNDLKLVIDRIEEYYNEDIDM